jgi:gamma-glutamylcyclotransferase (GGCT)/AIG2-like uncharacterized protein YtfP
MDNTRDLPGYKYYLDPATGERPAVYVAYLDLVPEPRSVVNGVVFAVDAGGLAALDRRERNYERSEVGDQLDPPTGGRVWAYFGTAAARERFESGRSAGTVVVERAYLDNVRRGFAQIAPRELDRFDASTDPPPVPMRDLKRVDTPPI